MYYLNWQDDKFLASFARAHRDDILKNPADYLDMYQKLCEDKEVYEYLMQNNPAVVDILKARAETLYVAERLESGLSTDTATPKETPEEYRERNLKTEREQIEHKIRASELAFQAHIDELIRLKKIRDDAIAHNPDLKEDIEFGFDIYRRKNGKEETDELTRQKEEYY